MPSIRSRYCRIECIHRLKPEPTVVRNRLVPLSPATTAPLHHTRVPVGTGASSKSDPISSRMCWSGLRLLAYAKRGGTYTGPLGAGHGRSPCGSGRHYQPCRSCAPFRRGARTDQLDALHWLLARGDSETLIETRSMSLISQESCPQEHKRLATCILAVGRTCDFAGRLTLVRSSLSWRIPNCRARHVARFFSERWFDHQFDLAIAGALVSPHRQMVWARVGTSTNGMVTLQAARGLHEGD